MLRPSSTFILTELEGDSKVYFEAVQSEHRHYAMCPLYESLPQCCFGSTLDNLTEHVLWARISWLKTGVFSHGGVTLSPDVSSVASRHSPSTLCGWCSHTLGSS